jgi:hypothetical protein
MLFVGSAAALCFVFCFPLFFGRSPFFGFIAFFATGLSVLYHPGLQPKWGQLGC